MAARKRRARTHRPTRNDPSAAVAQSAHAIWLAGLGAFERAREEGPKMFEALVAQGKGMGGKARQAADQALRELRAGRGLAGIDVQELTRQVKELGETVRRMATPPARTRRAAAARGSTVKRKVKRTAARVKRKATARKSGSRR
jgi:hypothetical protein